MACSAGSAIKPAVDASAKVKAFCMSLIRPMAPNTSPLTWLNSWAMPSAMGFMGSDCPTALAADCAAAANPRIAFEEEIPVSVAEGARSGIFEIN